MTYAARARLLRTPVLRNVVRDLRGSDDGAIRLPDGRDGERDIDERAVLTAAHRLVVLDTLARSDARQDAGFLVLMVFGDEDSYVFADHLFGLITEDAPRAAVPARDMSVERLGDDGVVSRVDDRGQPVGRNVGAQRVFHGVARFVGQRIYGRLLRHRRISRHLSP